MIMASKRSWLVNTAAAAFSEQETVAEYTSF